MARVWQSGAELNSVTNGVEITANNGSPVIVTSPVHGGTYAWRFNPTSASRNCRQTLRTSNQSTQVYARAYLYVTTFPSATTQVLELQNSSNTQSCALALTSGGVLQLKAGDNSQVGSNSATLSTGQWYMIGLGLDATSATGTIIGQLSGSTFASGANISGVAWEKLSFGIVTSTTADIYMDDISVNDTSGSAQTSWPPDAQIIHLRPNGTGDVNTFAVQVGGTAGSGNNYTRVSEVTPDDATSYNASAVINQEDLFVCTPSGIAANSVVNTVLVGTRQADLVSADATSGYKAEMIKVSGGTKLQSANIIPNSTSWSSNGTSAGSLHPLITYADPDGNPWTQATLDTMQIGYLLDAFSVQSVALSTVWANVEYSPAPAPSKGGTMTLMGVG